MAGSRYLIVEGNPIADKDDVIALLGNLPELSARRNAEARFSKYYETNPLGPPAFLLAREERTRRVVGMSALFPVSLVVSGKLIRGGIAGDFVVEPKHRAFGPALQLQKSLLAALPTVGFEYVYGTPNRASEAVFRRLGYTDFGRLTHFVKPLKVGFAVRRYTRKAAVARLSSLVVDPLLALLSKERRYRRPDGLVVDRPRSFDSRFPDMAGSHCSGTRVTGQRDFRQLNWKYETTSGEDAPRYTLFSVSRNGASVDGYLVYLVKNDIRHVVDISFSHPDILNTLVSEFILDSRRSGIDAIGLRYFGPRTLLTRSLRSFGFLRKPDTLSLMIHVDTSSPAAPALLEQSNWYFFAGDMDL